jgi:hypothetical protein
MLEQLFVDTGYVIALINENDRNHGQALALADNYDGYPLVTTDAVLLKIGNALSRIGRSQAVEISDYFQQAAEVTLVVPGAVLLQLGLVLGESIAASNQWILPAQPLEAAEVLVCTAQGSPVFDGQRGEVGIHHQVGGRLGLMQQAFQDGPMALTRRHDS